MGPIELQLDPDGFRQSRTVDSSSMNRVVPFQSGTVNEFDRPVGFLDTPKENIFYPVGLLFRIQILHPFSQGDTQACEIGILIDNLSNAFSCVLTNCVCIHDVTKKFFPISDTSIVVIIFEALGNKNIPIDKIGFNSSVFCHPEQGGPKYFPLGQFLVRKRSRFGKVFCFNQVRKGMEVPKR